MSLAATVVVASMPLLGGVHLDADAQGRALLTWSGYRGKRYVTRVLDVTTGRTQDLWRADSVSNVELSDFDVAASGAAVACFRDRKENAQAWRVLIRRRTPQGVWTGRRLITAPKGWVDDLKCGVGDAGQVTLTWVEGGGRRPVRAAFVAPDGSVEAPTTLATDPIDEPETVVAPDGTATVAYTLEPGRDRILHVAQRPPTGGWASRPVAPAFGPELAIDGTGRPVVGWSGWGEGDEALYFAAGPGFASGPFVREDDSALGRLVAGPRGDVLAVWYTSASRGDGFLRAAVQRPGAAFSAPVPLGRFGAYPLLAALGPDGGGAITTIGGTERRPRPFARLLRPDGTWGAQLKVQHEPAGLTSAGPGRFLLATTQRDRYGSDRVLRLRVLRAR